MSGAAITCYLWVRARLPMPYQLDGRTVWSHSMMTTWRPLTAGSAVADVGDLRDRVHEDTP